MPARRTSTAAAPLTHFEADAALHLVQALHREIDFEPFLKVLYSQVHALSNAHGMHFSYANLGVDILLGEHERHRAEYNLQYNGEDLGNLTLYFKVKANELEIETAEDLLSLSMPAFKNCLAVTRLQTQRRELEPSDAPTQRNSDALILVALDNYETIKTSAGEEWANTLMSSVHSQILEGLRASDGVYQISEELVAVLLGETTVDTAKQVAEKIRSLIAALRLNGEGDASAGLTACMGITDAEHAVTADDVMTNARTPLHQAQAKGANQIEVFA